MWSMEAKKAWDTSQVRLVEVAVGFYVGTPADLIELRPKGLQFNLEAEVGDFHCLEVFRAQKKRGDTLQQLQQPGNISCYSGDCYH